MKEEFDKLLLSEERNRKKKKYFPEHWISKGYKETVAYDLAYKVFTGTLSDEENAMTKITTKFNKDFFIIRGYTEEEAIEFVRKIQSDNVQKKLAKYSKEELAIQSSTSIEYWMNKGYTEEEAIEKRRERQITFSLEKCIERYGDEEGYKIWKERQERWQATLNSKSKEELVDINRRKSSSLEMLIEKYGEKEGTRRHELKCDGMQNIRTLEWYIAKYGEDESKERYDKLICSFRYGKTVNGYIAKYGEDEGKERYDTRIRKMKFYNSLDGYIAKYGEDEGKERWEIKCKKCACLLENYIAKYGEDEGKLKYEKVIAGRTNAFFSKESIRFFESFIPEDVLNESIYGEKEYFIYDKENKGLYFYDFKYKNLILEYHGTRFHVNPSWDIDKQKNWNNPFNKSVSYIDSLKYDEHKRDLVLEYGLNIIEIYSDSITEELKTKILEALNEENNN